MWLKKNEIEEELFFNREIAPTRRYYIPFPVKNGNTISPAECGTIVSQYRKYMAKHSNYICKSLSFHIRNYSCILKYKHSYLVGYNMVNYKKRSLFIVSHFAPFSLREGFLFLKSLKQSDTVTFFAVTDYCAAMLEKMGYIYICDIPQVFNHEIVNKQVYINNDRFVRLAKRLFHFPTLENY